VDNEAVEEMMETGGGIKNLIEGNNFTRGLIQHNRCFGWHGYEF